MDYSREKDIPFLQGAAKLLEEERSRLRASLAALQAAEAEAARRAETSETETARLRAELERERLNSQAIADKVARQNEELEREREEKVDLRLTSQAAEETIARQNEELEREREEKVALRLTSQAAEETIVRQNEELERERQEKAALRLTSQAAEETIARQNEELETEREAKANLQQELARLEAEMAALKELLDLRNKALYGRSTERRPKDDKNIDSKSKPNRERKKRKGHGRTSQPELPSIDVTHKLTDEKLVCDACGGQMGAVDTLAEQSELIAIEKRKVVLERHLRTVYACNCGQCIKTAPGPLRVIPKGRYALSFAVHIAYQKYFAHLPLERQVQAFAHDGARFTTAALWDQIDALATILKATYDAIWRAIQSEEILRADETPWAIMSNGHTANEKFYAWVCVGTRFVAFRLLDTRSAMGAASVLGNFAGTLMVDGLTSYPAAAKRKSNEAPGFIIANCNAHARRKFVECERYWPKESAHAVDLYRKIYAVERKAKGLPPAKLLELRQEKSKPLMDALFNWAREQQQRTDVLPSTGLAKAVAYLLNHEKGLRVFLDNPNVPVDNNESERAIRPLVLGRVNYLGSRSRRGTEVLAIISTLVESAKRCGVPPEAYLLAAAEHALTKAGNVLLPDEFKRQLENLRAPPNTG